MIPKYKNVKKIIDGIKFDSSLEARCYEWLRDNSEILELQPSFLLQDKFVYFGKKYREIKYIADFKILHNGDEIYIDSKGMETPEFKLKQKLLLKRYPDIIFTTVKSVKSLKEYLQ